MGARGLNRDEQTLFFFLFFSFSCSTTRLLPEDAAKRRHYTASSEAGRKFTLTLTKLQL